jgi:glycine cleavage system H protein
MSEVPQELRYSEEHEWLRVEGPEGVVGISAHAAERMGDIVFVELPEIGTRVSGGDTFGVIESPKAMADLYAPATGEVIEINVELEAHPEYVSDDPYGSGWMIKIKLEDPEEIEDLKDATAYEAFLMAED